MYKRILVATDGSEISQRAAEHGIALAKATGAQVLAVFVVDTRTLPEARPLLPESMAPYYFSLLQDLRKVGEEAVRQIVEIGAKQGVSVKPEVTEGTPAPCILEVVKKAGCDLVVMGTHGRTGLKSLLVGSTAQAVVHGATTPVLLVR